MDEILNLIESVSEGFPSYFSTLEDMEAKESPSCVPKGTIVRLPT